MEKKSTPDVGTLPKSGGGKLDKDGVNDTGYLDKKGTPSGMEAKFNVLPPGTNIDDQSVADIRELPMKMWGGGLSYPDDGGF